MGGGDACGDMADALLLDVEVASLCMLAPAVLLEVTLLAMLSKVVVANPVAAIAGVGVVDVALLLIATAVVRKPLDAVANVVDALVVVVAVVMVVAAVWAAVVVVVGVVASALMPKCQRVTKLPDETATRFSPRLPMRTLRAMRSI